MAQAQSGQLSLYVKQLHHLLGSLQTILNSDPQGNKLETERSLAPVPTKSCQLPSSDGIPLPKPFDSWVSPPDGEWIINHTGHAVLVPFLKSPLYGTWFMNSSGNPEFLPDGRQLLPLPQGGKWTISSSGRPEWVVTQNPTCTTEEQTTPPPGEWIINHTGYAILVPFQKMRLFGTWFMNTSGKPEFLPDGKIFPSLPQGGKWTISSSGRPEWVVTQNPTCTTEEQTTPPPGEWTINHTGYAILVPFQKMRLFGTWFMNTSGKPEFLPDGKIFPPLPQGGKWTISSSGRPEWVVTQNPTCTTEEQTTPPPGEWTINHAGYAILVPFQKMRLFGTWFMNTSGKPEFLPDGKIFPSLPQGGKWTISSSGRPEWVVTQNPTSTTEEQTTPPPGEWTINHTGYAILVPFQKMRLFGTWFMNTSGKPEFLPDGKIFPSLPQGGKWTISSSGRPEWVVTQNPTSTTEEQTTPPPGKWTINHTGYAILVPFQKMRLFGTWFMNTSGKPEFLPDGKIFPSLPQGGKWTISSSGRPEWVVTQNPTCTTEEQTTPPPGEWTINHTGYAILVPFQKMRLFGTWFMNTSGKPEFLPDGKIFPSLPQGGKWTISSSGRPEWVVTQNPTITTEEQTTPPPGEWTINHTGYAILVPFQKMRLFGTWFMNTSGKPEFLPDGKIFPSLPQGGKWTISSSGRPEWVFTQSPTITTEEQTTPPPGKWTINHTGYAILVPFQKMRLFGTWFMNTSGKPEFLPDGKIFPSLPQGGKWTISSSGRPEWVFTQSPTITTEEQTTLPSGKWIINETGHVVLNVSGKQLNGTWFMNISGKPEYLPYGKPLPPLPRGGKWTILSCGKPEWVVTQNPPCVTEEQTTLPSGKWIVNETGHVVLNVSGKQLNGTWFMNISGKPEYLPYGKPLPPLPRGGKWTILSCGKPEWVVTQNPPCVTEEQTTLPSGKWIVNETGHVVLNVSGKQLNGTWFMNISGKPEYLPYGKPLPPLPRGGKWTILSCGRPEWVVTPKGECVSPPPDGEWTIHYTGHAVLVPYLKGRHYGTWFMNASGNPEYLPEGQELPPLPKGGKWTISSCPKWVPMSSTQGATSERHYAPTPTRSQMPPKVEDGNLPNTSLQETYPIDSHPATSKVYQDVYKTLQNIDECVSKIMHKLG